MNDEYVYRDGDKLGGTMNDEYVYRDGDKLYKVPCSTCVYLIQGRVCSLPNCIRLYGWKGQPSEEKRGIKTE